MFAQLVAPSRMYSSCMNMAGSCLKIGHAQLSRCSSACKSDIHSSRPHGVMHGDRIMSMTTVSVVTPVVWCWEPTQAVIPFCVTPGWNAIISYACTRGTVVYCTSIVRVLHMNWGCQAEYRPYILYMYMYIYQKAFIVSCCGSKHLWYFAYGGMVLFKKTWLVM